MRLIDADKVIDYLEEVKKESPSLVDVTHIIGFQSVIDAQPTAYDVDTVVNQLELYSFEFGTDTLPSHYVRLSDAIAIVKEGGKMEARYKKLKSALKDIELDEEEEKTIRWLAGWEPETVDHMVSIMNKLKRKGE